MKRKPPPGYCDDWACPEKWGCAHHFCRSKAYWSMEERQHSFWRGYRNRWGCLDFMRDVSKPWLTKLLVAPCDDPPPKIPKGYKGPKLVK